MLAALESRAKVMSERPVQNILILGTQVPFTRGGAELLIERLAAELKSRDYTVDIVSLPFHAQPKSSLINQIAIWRALELNAFAGRTVDMVICTKFPSYLPQHARKVLWLIHQHRQLYELYGSRFGDFSTEPEDEGLRQIVLEADKAAIAECKSVFTISENVSGRLERYLGVPSEALHPPLPLGERYYQAEKKPYILSVGRLCSIKRVDLIVKALPRIHDSLRLKIVGEADEPEIDTYLRSEIEKHHLWHRVEFLGRVSDEELLKLYAESFAVFYAPFDEDYGFVTLEALASGSPVITARDSGTVLGFVEDGVNGLVVEPDEKSIATACNRLLDEPELHAKLSSNAPGSFVATTWDAVIERLVVSQEKSQKQVSAV